MPAGQPLISATHRYRNLSGPELAEMLRTLPKRPLLAGDQDVRLSLAGSQDKMAVKVLGDQISIPLDGAPSTHILKPVHPNFPGLVFNEVTCLQLATAVGLQTAKAEARSMDGIDYALVQRYDRKTGVLRGDEDIRLHQEDFCQALGIVPERKYQSEGGPSLKQCFGLIRQVSSAPVIDLLQLLDAVVFNYLIGNHDAHGKNLYLLYGTEPGEEIRLAPLYDLVCTLYYPELSKKMAMKIGDEYLLDRIEPRHFEALAEAAGLAKPLVKKRVPELARTVIEKIDTLGIAEPDALKVAQIIRGRSEKTIARFVA
jgi:serine/threonine-protein kinase HipA